jgi:4-amino-4-deoxy-L-arabinose transferase-like glycosyltransferase
VLLWVVAFVPRALTAVHGFPHPDEVRWLQRSGHYAHAILTLDLTKATSSESSVHGHPTMPGITTTLVGGIDRVIWGGLRDLGVASFPGDGFRSSHSALVLAQLLMALATSGLLVLLWWVLCCWSTRVVATTAVLILATEPVLVADNTKLTTDSFLVLFGAIGAFALAAAFEVPRHAERRFGRRRRTVLAIVAGIGIGGALASKTTALAFVPFFLGLTVYALWRGRRTRAASRDVVQVATVAVLVGVGLLAAIWPAVWADPSGKLELVRGTERLARTVHSQFFLGELTGDPGPLYYFVVVPLRMTPWFALLGIAGVVVGLRVRALRGYGIVALAYAALPFLTIVLA